MKFHLLLDFVSINRPPTSTTSIFPSPQSLKCINCLTTTISITFAITIAITITISITIPFLHRDSDKSVAAFEPFVYDHLIEKSGLYHLWFSNCEARTSISFQVHTHTHTHTHTLTSVCSAVVRTVQQLWLIQELSVCWRRTSPISLFLHVSRIRPGSYCLD